MGYCLGVPLANETVLLYSTCCRLAVSNPLSIKPLPWCRILDCRYRFFQEVANTKRILEMRGGFH